jgi:hypothetical protein
MIEFLVTYEAILQQLALIDIGVPLTDAAGFGDHKSSIERGRLRSCAGSNSLKALCNDGSRAPHRSAGAASAFLR